MAAEIKIACSITHANGSRKQSCAIANKSLTQTENRGTEKTVTVGASAEALDFDDIATTGLVMVENLDTTKTITWGPDSSGTLIDCGTISPGMFALFEKTAAATLKWKSSSGNCEARLAAWGA